jgi:hypothetical protein
MSFNAPNSAVDICNLALIELKQATIVQLNPASTVVEQILALEYHQVRRAVLRKHSWNCASTRTSLTPSSTAAPDFGYSHGYLLPNDYIRKIGLYDSDDEFIEQQYYDLEDGKIYYNGEDNTAIYLKYVYDLTTVSKMDPLLISMFVLELAVAIAPKFSGTEARQAAIDKRLEKISAEAKSIDGQERPPQRRQKSRWLARRRNYPTRQADGFTRFS